MSKSKKGGKDLRADLAWAKRELLAGRRCWCVRTRRGGLVVEFLSSPPEMTMPVVTYGGTPDGSPPDTPLEEFTLTPITLVNGEPKFAAEQPWPNPAAEQRKVNQFDSMRNDINLAALSKETDH